ncbi:MAG: hypothetical protein FD180_171 [Planctomycetota bacterium]|nr:MAG: hypothetical protein FD180_171 [Planctomycetota bacterium]
MQRTFATACVLALAFFSRVGADPAKEIADLEKKFEGSSKPRKENYAELRPEFEAFAKKHAGTAEGLKAKLWLLQNTWWVKDDKGTMEDAAAALADGMLKEYAKFEDLARVAEWGYVFRKEKHAELLAALMAADRPDAVRAAAGLANAIRVKKAGNPREAKPLFEAVAKDFGRLKQGTTTYAALADAHVNEHALGSLAVGKPAPEITGFSPDGRPMKLSDYKGRVVVIDFFGDW